MSHMGRNPEFALLERQYGIHFPQAIDYTPPGVAMDLSLAMDAAQLSPITASNSSIPFWLTNYQDPKLIEVLVAPNKAAQIFGEVKKGDWTTLSTSFTMVEHMGEVSNYGDWNNNGSTSANLNFPYRQSLHYQTITQWGERELDLAGLAKVDWAQRMNIASAMVLDKAQNYSYFYGVQNLQNYGLLNDPNLPAALTPGTKTTNSPKWMNGTTVTATANEIFADVQSLFIQLTTQTNGLVDADTAMVFAMSPGLAMALTTTNSFNVNVFDLLKKNFPNITFETAPQYATAAGQMMQLIAKSINGQDTGYCAFTEKMRAHKIVADLSAWKQKKSQGTWGAIIIFPIAIASMIGM